MKAHRRARPSGAEKEPRGGYRESGCEGEFQDLIPFSLQGKDGAQVGQGEGNTGAQGQVRAKEVVVSDEEGGEREGAVASGEAAGRADVVLVSGGEAFDELLEGAKFG